ncbi:tetratricopeptide repeat protein [Kutzneria buriramensis]|uniref:tetratricopeptide repeat protein n=1 Tax=Kutzneria buriramensis TaxID=1045776 RepID=UPI0011C10675|nr:tetratricopeptide repeat protein [Kutzneria buriramensis]
MTQQPDDPVDNGVSGTVSGNVVQAHTINGGVHMHAPAGRVVTLPHRAGIMPPRAAYFQRRTVVEPGLSGDGQARTSVVSGMGGVGKTQLALDYADALWAAGEVDLLAWITAVTREAIMSGYARLAADLTGAEDDDPEYGSQRLLEWLAGTPTRWLIVLDGLQSPRDLHGLWPPVTPTGRALVTTRRRDAALHGHRRRVVEIGVFAPDEAHCYLRAALAARPQLLDGVEGLAARLGYLPLALAQAGAYMLDRDLACAAYQARLSDRRRSLAALLPDADGLPDEHQATVTATWSLSIEQADRLQPFGLAGPLLAVASLMDPNGIPVEVFTTRAVLELLGAMVSRPITEDDARDGLACLQRLSLLTVGKSSSPRAVRTHALVQRATRESQPADQLSVLVLAVADALVQVWPDVERDAVLGQVLRANVDVLYDVGGEHLWEPGVHEVLWRAGRSLGDSGWIVQADEYFDRLHGAAVERLGPDHPDTLSIRSNVAYWRGEAGDPVATLAAFEALLADELRVLGPDHRETLATRGNIARWLGELGDPHAARAALEDLLAAEIEAFGPHDVFCLTTRGDIAYWQGEAGDPVAALDVFEALLADQLRLLGPDHRDTLTTQGNVAYWRGAAGDPVAAVETFEALLVDQSRVLGPGHRAALTTRSHIAFWLGEAGEPARALDAFEALLADLLRVLGPDHPDTLNVHREVARRRP